MKVNDQDKQTLSVAIDQLNEGLDAFIHLYNEAEEDQPLIVFDDDTIQIIENAKKTFDSKKIDEKINKIIKEIFSLLPMNDAESTEDQPK